MVEVEQNQNETVEAVDDDFTAAFKRFSTPNSDPTVTAETPPAEVTAEQVTANAEPVPAETPAPASAEPVTPPAGETPQPAEQTPPPAPPVPVLDDQFFDKFAQAIRRQDQVPAPQPQPAPAQAPLFDAGESQFISSFEKDYPDVAKAYALQLRANNQVLVQHIFQQVAQTYQPYMDMLVQLAEQTHIQSLHQAIPDYDSVRDNVISWVERQPAYLQAAYKRVIQSGTQEEIADMVERYRQTNPAAAPAATPKQTSELPPAAKQAAAALAPVGSKRTAVVTGGVQQMSFDDAFAHFARQSKT